MRIGLISCGKRKHNKECQARDMYTSTLFKFSRTYVEKYCDEYGIISAKYGLLLPQAIIKPYDLTIKDLPKGEYTMWQLRVRSAIITQWGTQNTFISLLPNKYEECILGLGYFTPLQGMGIGKRMGYLKKENERSV